MLVVPELDDPFLPLPDDLLVNLRESRGVLEALLDALPANFAAATGTDSCTGPALQVGLGGVLSGWISPPVARCAWFAALRASHSSLQW